MRLLTNILTLENECAYACMCASERGFAVFGSSTACDWEYVCAEGGVRVCLKLNERRRVLWDVSVLEQCVVVQP